MKGKPTETKSKLTFGIARHLLSWVICLGAVILPGSSASAQNLFAVDVDSAVGFTGIINEFTANGVPSIFTSGLNGPNALAFDGAGNLLVADVIYSNGTYTGTIYKFSPEGVRTTFASGLFDPRGLAIDSTGNLFVADVVDNNGTYSATIYKFAPDGVRTTFAVVPGANGGLAFDRADNLFVAAGTFAFLQSNTGLVYKFTPTGVRTIFARLNYPFALAVDSHGNLFVADGGYDGYDLILGAGVYKFTPSGRRSTVGSDIEGWLAVDGADNLFVADTTILRITPSGVRTTFASRLVGALAFQPTQTGTSTPTPTPTPTPAPTSTPLPVPMPAVTVTVSPSSIARGADATFTISASPINPSDVTTVHYSMGGKAKSEINYTLSGIFGQAEIPAGASSTTVTLHALTGPMKGQSKNAILKLMPATNYVLSNPRKASVTIVKGPPIVVRITRVTTQPLLGGMQVTGELLRWDQGRP